MHFITLGVIQNYPHFQSVVELLKKSPTAIDATFVVADKKDDEDAKINEDHEYIPSSMDAVFDVGETLLPGLGSLMSAVSAYAVAGGTAPYEEAEPHPSVVDKLNDCGVRDEISQYYSLHMREGSLLMLVKWSGDNVHSASVEDLMNTARVSEVKTFVLTPDGENSQSE